MLINFYFTIFEPMCPKPMNPMFLSGLDEAVVMHLLNAESLFDPHLDTDIARRYENIFIGACKGC